MSLASDILKRAGIDLAPPKRRKGNSTYLELNHKRRVRCRNDHLHMARISGLHHRSHKWDVTRRHNGRTYCVGRYDTVQQAIAARDLWDYMRSQGYTGDEIPLLNLETAYRKPR